MSPVVTSSFNLEVPHLIRKALDSIRVCKAESLISIQALRGRISEGGSFSFKAANDYYLRKVIAIEDSRRVSCNELTSNWFWVGQSGCGSTLYYGARAGCLRSHPVL